jgi:hypothetical protein
MPLNNPAPNFGLLTSWDMRGLTGVSPFSRGGTLITLPSYSAGEGVYDDVVLFLNGRISSSSVNADAHIAIVKTFGASWAISINSSDHVRISSDTEFEITSTGAIDGLGFGSVTVSSVLVGSDYVATAPHDWARGVSVLSDMSYTIDEVGGAGTFDLFSSLSPDVQDISTWVRATGSNDADDFGLTSLQELDNTAMGSSSITWLITDSGHTQCHYPTAVGDLTWLNDELRNLLGFTGDEQPVLDGLTYRLTSTYKCSGVLIPSRPYQSHHLSVEQVSQSRRKIGGGYVANYIGTYVSSQLTFDLDALLDAVDDYRHFTNKFLPLVSDGERINFYQSWGDSRRALITADVNADQPAYDSLYTSEHNGAYGRIRGSLKTASYDLSYPTRLQRRVPVSVEIEHL